MKLTYALAAIVALTSGLHIAEEGKGDHGPPPHGGDGEGKGPDGGDDKGPDGGDEGPHGDDGERGPDPCDILPDFVDDSTDPPTVDFEGLVAAAAAAGEEMTGLTEEDVLDKWW